MENIVERLKFAGITGRLTGKEYHGKCPFCSKNKFYVNIKSGKYICFSGSCAKKGHIASILGNFQVDINEVFNKSLFYQDKEGNEIDVEHDIKELDDYKYIHRYILDRGFDKGFLAANKIGYDKETHRITIPMFFDQKYFGCIKRTVIDQDPKYIYPPGLPKKEILYVPPVCEAPGDSKWINKNKKVLLVVEGSLDALKAAQNGYRAMATLGCFITAEQMSLIEEYARSYNLEIVLMFDDDEAGHKATDEALDRYFWVDMKVANWEALNEHLLDKESKVCNNEGKDQAKRDVGDLSADQLEILVKHSKDRFEFVLDSLFNLTEF
jgi:DNA primase